MIKESISFQNNKSISETQFGQINFDSLIKEILPIQKHWISFPHAIFPSLFIE